MKSVVALTVISFASLCLYMVFAFHDPPLRPLGIAMAVVAWLASRAATRRLEFLVRKESET